MGSASTSRRSIFRSERYLTPRYTPDAPVVRDRIVEHVMDAVQPVIHGKTPENVVLYGPAGTGKTTVVTHVLGRVASTRVTTAAINCWQFNTRPALLAELLIQLGYPAPRKGRPVDELLARLREWLAKHHGLVVALDEVDQLRHLTEIIYDLRHASTAAATAVGLLLISNQATLADRLESRSQSRFAHHTIRVPRYDAGDLYAILCDRAGKAFQPDVVEDDVLHLIAEAVADRSGDCRRALDLLLWAGRAAEREDADRISDTHVQGLLE